MNVVTEGVDLLEAAVRAAKRGDGGAARSLLLHASEVAPDHDRVWLWLAQLSSSPADKVSYLRRVLETDPGHEVARAELADTLRDEGVAAAKAGSRKRARALLESSLELDRNRADSWLWLAAVAETEGERRRGLAEVLAIDPEHRQALALLALLTTPNGPETGGSADEEVGRRPPPDATGGDGPPAQEREGELEALIEQLASFNSDLLHLTYQRSSSMANIKESLQSLAEADGFIGACLVDSNSGMMMGSEGGGGGMNLEAAAAGNTEVVRAKRKTMATLGLKDAIEDILITLGKQYHLIRPVSTKDGLFIYLVLDKSRSNLALARHKLAEAEKNLAI